HFGARQQRFGAELAVVTSAGDDLLVEWRQGHDKAYVVSGNHFAQLGDVARIVHPRDERVPVRVVERGCKGIDVGRDGGRAGAAEGGDDIDTPAGAREQDGG